MDNERCLNVASNDRISKNVSKLFRQFQRIDNVDLQTSDTSQLITQNLLHYNNLDILQKSNTITIISADYWKQMRIQSKYYHRTTQVWHTTVLAHTLPIKGKKLLLVFVILANHNHMLHSNDHFPHQPALVDSLC